MKTKSVFLMVLVIVVTAFSNNTYAQDSDSKINVSQVVDVSADKVWGIIRQMDNVDKFSPQIAKVTWSGDHGVGGERVCYGPDGNAFVKEGIVQFDDVARSYSYAIIEGSPANNMVNTFKVVDLGYNKSMVLWSSKYSTFKENPNFTEDQFRGAAQFGFVDFISKIAMEASKS